MLGDVVAVVLDAGETPGEQPSTIVDCTGDRPRILREGAISAREIHRVLEDTGHAFDHETELSDADAAEAADDADADGRGRQAPCVSTSSSSWSAGTVSYLLCVVARELAMHSGAVAQVRDRDVHAIPIPYFGGIAMLGGLGAGYLVAHHLPFLSLAGDQVFHDAGVVLVAGAIICAVGVVDDLIELDALTKLGGQVLAAGFMVLNGVQFYSLNLPGVGQFSLDPSQGMILTILLVVGTVNAVNFVDGLDGLAGGCGRHRRGRVLRLLLQARRRQRRDPGDHGRAAVRGARRRLRRLPAAQLLRRPASSWATPGRCCSASCSPGPRSP